MADDLPIYSESILRTRLQFADLERLKGIDTSVVWEKSDKYIEQFEGAVNVRRVRESIMELTKPNILQAHSILFSGRDGAGALRRQSLKPLIRYACPWPTPGLSPAPRSVSGSVGLAAAWSRAEPRWATATTCSISCASLTSGANWAATATNMRSSAGSVRTMLGLAEP